MIEIRSYRRVFDLERRIYRVDKLRLNPGGVPVRGVVYFLVILLAALIAMHVPLLRLPARALPWYVRDVVLPVAGAGLLTIVRVEGRPFHLAAHALLRYRFGPRRLAGLRRAAVGERWDPSEIVLLPDGSDAALRGVRYTGPGAVLVAVSHERSDSRPADRLSGTRHADVTLRGLPGGGGGGGGGGRAAGGQVIVLARGARLLVRSSTARQD